MVNMGTVWDRTTEFLSDNLGAVLPIALLAMFVPQSIAGVVQQAGAVISPVLSQGLPLLLFLPIIWGQLAIAALAIDPDSKRVAAQSVATRRIGAGIAALLIPFAVTVLAALPMLIALAAGGVDLSAFSNGKSAAPPELSPTLSGIVIVNMVVLLVVVPFISIRFSALLFAIVAAEGGIVSALRRSFVLSRSAPWKMLAVYFLFFVVYLVGYLAVTLVFGALFQLVAPGAGPFGIGAIVVAILGGLVNTSYYVIISAFSAKLYRAVGAARERA